jgi:hypothetical protein
MHENQLTTPKSGLPMPKKIRGIGGHDVALCPPIPPQTNVAHVLREIG